MMVSSPHLKTLWVQLDPSAWPLLVSVCLMGMLVGFVVWAWSSSHGGSSNLWSCWRYRVGMCSCAGKCVFRPEGSGKWINTEACMW